MFDFKEWLKSGLIDGYKQGSFSMPYIITMTANYIVAGMLTQSDAAEIQAACAAWDEELKRIEEEKKAQEETIKNTPTVLPEWPEEPTEDVGDTPTVLPSVDDESTTVV